MFLTVESQRSINIKYVNEIYIEYDEDEDGAPNWYLTLIRENLYDVKIRIANIYTSDEAVIYFDKLMDKLNKYKCE